MRKNVIYIDEQHGVISRKAPADASEEDRRQARRMTYRLPTFDDEDSEAPSVDMPPAHPSNHVAANELPVQTVAPMAGQKVMRCTQYRSLTPAERIEYERDMAKIKEKIEVISKFN